VAASFDLSKYRFEDSGVIAGSRNCRAAQRRAKGRAEPARQCEAAPVWTVPVSAANALSDLLGAK